MSTMPVSRRQLLRRSAAVTLSAAVTTPAIARAAPAVRAGDRLAELERRHGARLGVHAVNHRTGAVLAYRADERFAFCSTYKGLLAARVLRDFAHDQRFLNRIVHYTRHDLIEGAFVTRLYLQTGMTVRALCAAALAYSDNVAANLLFELTGGPRGLTRFLRTLGDDTTRSDRFEPALNTAIPGDPRDTTTPRAIAGDYSRLLLGDALSGYDRAQLRFWMEGDAVNIERFRAGLPADWLIADKTGTGEYGSANDVGVVWTADGAPLTIAVLTTRPHPQALPDDALVAAAARIVADALS